MSCTRRLFEWPAFAAILILLLLAAPVTAVIHTLDPGDSIQAAVSSAGAGDIIILNPGIYYDNGTVIETGITIRANTSAGGNPSNTIIDGLAGDRIFNITGMNPLAIDNLTLCNGHTPGDGGAIASYLGGNLTITSSRISNCSAERGGGIFALHGSHMILNSSMVSNTTATQGGAFCLDEGSNLFLNASAVTRCSAGRGGALYQDNGSNAWMLSSEITGCSAGQGGAVYNDRGSNMRFAGTGIAGCSADQGGAVYNDRGSNMWLSGSGIADCTARQGGAISHDRGSNLFMIASSIAGCSATGGNGGAIGSVNGSNLFIDASAITGSSAPGGEGGAIGSSGGSTVMMNATDIRDCSSARGGAIANTEGSRILLAEDRIAGCSAEYGGSIYDNQGSLALLFLSEIANSSATYGGAIYHDHGNTLTLISSTISHASATCGGAVYIRNGSAFLVTGSNITDSSAEFGGAVCSLDKSRLIMASSSVTNCSAGSSGGAVYNSDSGIITEIISTTFDGCSAPVGNGGAVYNANATPFTITSSTFTRCSAQDGSAVYATNSTGTLVFSRLYPNTGPEVSAYNGSLAATDNWWGSNADPRGSTAGTVTSDPWLVLGIAADPPALRSGSSSSIRANLLYDSAGLYHDPADGQVPDGIPVSFAVTQGTGGVIPSAGNLTSGAGSTIFTIGDGTTARVNATVDNQSVGVLLVLPVTPTPVPSEPGDSDDGGLPAAVPSTLPPSRQNLTNISASDGMQMQTTVPAREEPLTPARDSTGPAAGAAGSGTGEPAPSGGTAALPVVPLLVGAGCVLLIGGIWRVRRWWIRRQNPALFRKYP